MPPRFSDYLVFVDESGDHSLESVDPQYPMFVLAFCIFEKGHYIKEVCPAVAAFKCEFFGHDGVILHEHAIRKQAPPFGILTVEDVRTRFMQRLDTIVEQAQFTVIACVIRKDRLDQQYRHPESPYHLAVTFGLERLARHLDGLGQSGRTTHVVFERRGRKEDRDIELEFRRVCGGANSIGRPLPFLIEILDKQSNSCGLQVSDLIARPIGLRILRPGQPNRAWEIIEPKLRRSPAGGVEGWGLKVFPG